MEGVKRVYSLLMIATFLSAAAASAAAAAPVVDRSIDIQVQPRILYIFISYSPVLRTVLYSAILLLPLLMHVPVRIEFRREPV